MLDASEAAEEIIDDGDAPMDSDDSDDDGDEHAGEDKIEIDLVNHSAAYFDVHTDSVYALARHPTDQTLFVSGAGDDKGYLWKVVPESMTEPLHTEVVAELTGHSDTVISVGFLKPDGKWLFTAGMDGQVRVYRVKDDVYGAELKFEAKEVEEIVWAEPHPSQPMFVVGAVDGSCWVYNVDTDSSEVALVSSFHAHTMSCTAGAWTPSGRLICTVSEDGSLYVWDAATGQGEVGLTSRDQRFSIEGGLYAVAVHPAGTLVVVGGASGECKVVALPAAARLPGRKNPGGEAAGTIVASMAVHEEGVESLSFSMSPMLPLLASGGVDGKLVLYDASRNFAVRKTIDDAHDGAVVKVEFATRDSGADPSTLTTVGFDGRLKRWDVRTGSLIGTWRGHSEAILGFVQGPEGAVITAGDDNVCLLFDTNKVPEE